MIKGNLMNNTKKRRKGSMMQDNLSKIKYLFLLAFLLALPMQAMAQGMGTTPYVDQTDTGSDRIVAYWDTRTRDTLVQVTNTSSSDIEIHVQVYDVNSDLVECEECNFDDFLTPNDTHVYDLENMMTNAGVSPKCTEIGSDNHGIIVISSYDSVEALIGTFRIIDEAGYEYRANAAGEDVNADEGFLNIIAFNDANGNNLSDVVGITYASVSQGFVYASPGVSAKFGAVDDELFIVDENEEFTSCSPTTFACADGLLNKGIDNSLPNSKGANRMCATSILDTFTSGWVFMPFDSFGCSDPEVCRSGEPNFEVVDYLAFVGFIGLNNGDGTGSMDSWWSIDLSSF
jgi:hypothetical protein